MRHSELTIYILCVIQVIIVSLSLCFENAQLDLSSPNNTIQLKISGYRKAMRMELIKQWPTSEIGVVVIDMWDKHWCPTYGNAAEELVAPMNETISKLRLSGMKIIFAPSEAAKYYRDHYVLKRVESLRKRTMLPSRGKVLAIEKLARKSKKKSSYRSKGCPDEDAKFGIVWQRQHPGLTITSEDFMIRNGLVPGLQDIISIIHTQKLRHLIYMGVHLNMCILAKPVGIFNTAYFYRRKWSRDDIVVVRDLTADAFNPLSNPALSVTQAHRLQLDLIERNYAFSTSSEDLLASLSNLP